MQKSVVSLNMVNPSTFPLPNTVDPITIPSSSGAESFQKLFRSADTRRTNVIRQCVLHWWIRWIYTQSLVPIWNL